jgi:hypothetical protein
LIIPKLIITEGKKHWLVKLLFSKFFFGFHEKSIEKSPNTLFSRVCKKKYQAQEKIKILGHSINLFPHWGGKWEESMSKPLDNFSNFQFFGVFLRVFFSTLGGKY